MTDERNSQKPERSAAGAATGETPSNTVLGLNETELEDAARRSAPRAAIVYEAIRLEGREELVRSASGLVWSGLAAGLSMGFSFLMEVLLNYNLPGSSGRNLVTRLGYSIGFLIVVLGRQQLFTENTLTPILHLLHVKSLETLLRVLRLWLIVLGANILGAFIFTLLVAKTGLLSSDMDPTLSRLALEVFGRGFGRTLISGVFAGWLIATMVWLLPFAESARVAVIIIMTYVVGLAGFSHIIAGSVNGFYAIVTGKASLAMFAFKFFLPALVGNIIGGVGFVSAINYAQVRGGPVSGIDD